MVSIPSLRLPPSWKVQRDCSAGRSLGDDLTTIRIGAGRRIEIGGTCGEEGKVVPRNLETDDLAVEVGEVLVEQGPGMRAALASLALDLED